MSLQGVIDAAVQGGVQKYREAFFTEQYVKESPAQAPLIEALKQTLSQQLKTLRKGLSLFGGQSGEEMRPLFEHLNSRFRKMVDDLTPIIGKR